MTSSKRVLFLLMFVAALMLAPRHFAAAQGLVVTDYMPPPASFDKYWGAVNAVVRGTLETRSVRAIDRARPTVDTHHVLRVLEVLKDDGAIGSRTTINISDAGGSTRLRDREIKAEPGPVTRLPLKQEVIVFLQRARSADLFVVAFGPAGLFIVADGDVSVPHGVRHYKEFYNKSRMSTAELRTLIRSIEPRR